MTASFTAFLTALGLLVGWPSVNLGGGVAVSGPTLLYENSFEGDTTSNCTTTDESTSTDATTEHDCDSTADAAEPDGTQSFEDGLSGSVFGQHWDNVFTARQVVWVKFWAHIIEDESIGTYEFRLRSSAAGTTNYGLGFNDAANDAARAVCGSVPNTQQLTNTASIASWIEFKLHIDSTTGNTEAWCSGAPSACGDDFTAAADFTCDGTADSVSFRGFTLTSSSSASYHVRLDHVRLYDQDPD